jgi:hypothetical protein
MCQGSCTEVVIGDKGLTKPKAAQEKLEPLMAGFLAKSKHKHQGLLHVRHDL